MTIQLKMQSPAEASTRLLSKVFTLYAHFQVRANLMNSTSVFLVMSFPLTKPDGNMADNVYLYCQLGGGYQIGTNSTNRQKIPNSERLLTVPTHMVKLTLDFSNYDGVSSSGSIKYSLQVNNDVLGGTLSGFSSGDSVTPWLIEDLKLPPTYYFFFLAIERGVGKYTLPYGTGSIGTLAAFLNLFDVNDQDILTLTTLKTNVDGLWEFYDYRRNAGMTGGSYSEYSPVAITSTGQWRSPYFRGML